MSELEAVLQQENARLKEELAQTQHQLQILMRHVFGRKSEQTPPPSAPGQMDLELETENAAIEAAPPAPAAKSKGGSRKGRKTRAALLPDDLPVEEHVFVPPQVQASPEQWREIGREVTEKLERIPGKLIRLRVVRPTYVSKEQPFAAPVTAPALKDIAPGSFLGPQLLADIALGKYLQHQPLYRQARVIEWDSGVKLSQATLCQSMARVADALAPVARCMAQQLWQSGYVQMDLTPVRCLSRDHPKGSFLGQMWVAAQPGGDVLYTWDKSKQALVAERIVPASFCGVLQCDGGSEIACFLRGGKERTRPPPQILRAGCWAHVRRKFFEAAESGCSKAARLLKIINVLYRIEGCARAAGFDFAERARLRQRRARCVLKGLRWRIDATVREVRPKSPVGKACLYALGQWEALLVYIEHGEVEIDNNGVENAIRPCAQGKKNWLFIGDVGAGQRAATFYSILGSCLRRGINPRAYLHWLFARLPHATNQTVHELTPAAYQATMATGSSEAQKVLAA